MPQGYNRNRSEASPPQDVNGSSFIVDHDCEEIMSIPAIAQYPRLLGLPTTDLPAGVGKARNAAATPPDCRQDPPPGPDLSHREVEVLGYLPTMLTAGEIAAELYVSVNTVKAHVRSIYSKLGVTRRRAAVDLARRRGIL